MKKFIHQSFGGSMLLMGLLLFLPISSTQASNLYSKGDVQVSPLETPLPTATSVGTGKLPTDTPTMQTAPPLDPNMNPVQSGPSGPQLAPTAMPTLSYVQSDPTATPTVMVTQVGSSQSPPTVTPTLNYSQSDPTAAVTATATQVGSSQNPPTVTPTLNYSQSDPTATVTATATQGGSSQNPPTATPTLNYSQNDPTATVTATATATRSDPYRFALNRAKQLVASHTGIPAEQLTIVTSRYVVWPDTARGCPQPGEAYNQIEVPGFEIIVDANNTPYLVHVDVNLRGSVFFCTGNVDWSQTPIAITQTPVAVTSTPTATSLPIPPPPVGVLPTALLPSAPSEQAAIEFLASQTGVPASQISLVASDTVTWPSTALGCPIPDTVYVERPIAGYALILSDGVGLHRVHVASDSSGLVVICQDGLVGPPIAVSPLPPPPTAAPPLPPPPTAAGPQPPTPTPTPISISNPSAQVAIALLASQTGVPASQISIVASDYFLWPSTALGCPYPDRVYVERPIAGYVLTLFDGVGLHRVHVAADSSGLAVNCQGPISPQPSTPLPPPTAAPPLPPPPTAAGPQPPTPTPTPISISNPSAQVAIALLASQTGVPASQISITASDYFGWSSTALGCPYPDGVYVQRPIAGYALTMFDGAKFHRVHVAADASGLAVICNRLVGPQPSTPTAAPTVTATPTESGPDRYTNVELIAINTVSEYTGNSKAPFTIVSSQYVVWPNGAAGCPQPYSLYTADTVPGHEVIVEQNGDIYRVHVIADVTGYAFICRSSLVRPDPPPTPTATRMAVGADQYTDFELTALYTVAESRGTSITALTIVSVQSVVWPDGALGCGGPDTVHTRPVPGYEVVVAAGGKLYRVHVGEGSNAYAFICDKDPIGPQAPTATPTLSYVQSDPTATPTLSYAQSDPTATPTLSYTQSDPTATPTLSYAQSNPTATPTPYIIHAPTHTPTMMPPTYTPAPYIPPSGLRLDGRWVSRVVGNQLSSSLYAVVDLEDRKVLYRSHNDGRTWRQVMNTTSGFDYAGLSAIGQDNFVVNAADPNILYSGSNYSCADMMTNGLDVVESAPMYKSANGGISWHELPNSTNMRLLLSHAHQSDVLFATDCVWVYVTTDGGQSWTPTPSLSETDALWSTYKAIRMIGVYDDSSQELETVYVGAVEADGGGDGDSLIASSSDLGRNWQKTTSPSGLSSWQLRDMAVGGNSIWFIDPSGFWETKTLGLTWSFIDRGIEDLVIRCGAGGQANLNVIAAHPSGWLYLGTNQGLYRSSAETPSWSKITGTDFDTSRIHGILFTNSNPNILYLNSDEGVYVTALD